MSHSFPITRLTIIGMLLYAFYCLLSTKASFSFNAFTLVIAFVCVIEIAINITDAIIKMGTKGYEND